MSELYADDDRNDDDSEGGTTRGNLTSSVSSLRNKNKRSGIVYSRMRENEMKRVLLLKYILHNKRSGRKSDYFESS